MRFYLTTAIDYVNSRPHLGQAYEKVSADVIARYKRGCGVDTHFLMGNDEHSQNVYKKAREAGLDPLAYCAEMEQVFRERWAELTISFDDFIRTTEPRHRAAVQKLAQRSYEAGDIYEGTYEGWYCVSCEAFRQEKDLVDGKCPFHPTLTPEWIKEKNYFFRLSKYRDRLLAHFEANPRFLQPDVRRNEILRLLEAGLDDISMSRAGQAWGIPLPFAPENVVYVWFDALINYASAVGYGTDDARFAQWWPADLHVIGKDITRFHTVVWPAMLWSAGVEAPRQVFGHGWINYGGQRMSKTLGTSVDPADLVAKFGPDPARLYLTKEIAFGNDGDFTWERYEERYNADLANNLGNLVSRVTAMVHKYRAGTVVPAGSGGALAAVVTGAAARYHDAMGRLALHEGTAAAFDIVTAANGFVAEQAPWALAKDPQAGARLDAVLFEVSEAVRAAATLLLPVMPTASAELLRRLGDATPAAEVRLDRDGGWRNSGARTLATGPVMWPRTDLAASETRRECDDEEGDHRGRDRTSAEGAGRRHCADAAPPAPGAGRRRRPHRHRRLHESRAPRGQDRRRRSRPEVQEADSAHRRRGRGRATHHRRRHRRGLSARGSARTHDRHRRQPEASQADGHRVERDGAGGES